MNEQNKSAVCRLGSHPAIISLLLALITLALYWPVTGFEFVNYDDPDYVTQNPQIQNGLTWQGAFWAFKTFQTGNWLPMTWLTHMLDYQVFGLKPWGFHLTNLSLHAANSVLLFLVLRRMTGAVWRSAFVAALFAWHPLHVESVAWVSERKDVLSAFFFMLTLGAYAAYAKRKSMEGVSEARVQRAKIEPLFQSSRFFYIFALFFFALGLMSKPMLVSLPLILLLLDYWPLGRFGSRTASHGMWSLLWEKTPFFAMAAAASIVTLFAQHNGGALTSAEALPMVDRVINALMACCRYLGSTIWPANLSVFYPYQLSWIAWQVLGAALLVAGPTELVIQQARKMPELSVGWFWFLVMLAPVIGLVQVGGQAMADRYMYLPSVGLFLICAWAACHLAHRGIAWRYGVILSAIAALGCCTAVTYHQTGFWKNSIRLFEHAARVTPGNALAHNNLGTEFMASGDYLKAEEHLLLAIKYRAHYATAYNNLGIVYARLRKPDQASACFEKAIRCKTNYADAYNNLGNLFNQQRKPEDAIMQFQWAIRLDPSHRDAYFNLANTLAAQGRPVEAEQAYKMATQLSSRSHQSESYFKYANFLAQQQRMPEAAEAYRRALIAKPNFAEAQNNLANALYAQGKTTEAVAHYSETLALDPSHAGAHYNLGEIFVDAGHIEQARDQYEAALRLEPEFADARLGLGKLALKAGQPAEAAEQFEAVLKSQPSSLVAQDGLGQALKALGQPEAAEKHFREAARLRAAQTQPEGTRRHETESK